MNVVVVTDGEHLDRLLEDWDNVVICFTAPSWCVPCQRLEPHFEAIAEKMPEVVFAKVDVDHLKHVSDDHGVMGVPTLMYFRAGHYEKHLVGRNVNQLFTEIKEVL